MCNTPNASNTVTPALLVAHFSNIGPSLYSTAGKRLLCPAASLMFLSSIYASPISPSTQQRYYKHPQFQQQTLAYPPTDCRTSSKNFSGAFRHFKLECKSYNGVLLGAKTRKGYGRNK
jgi:hypothetical protein